MDFAATTLHLTFTSSPMELCRNFTIEDDLVIEEQQEQFGLMLFTSDSAVKFGTQTASVTITDNDSMCYRVEYNDSSQGQYQTCP